MHWKDMRRTDNEIQRLTKASEMLLGEGEIGRLLRGLINIFR